MWVGDEEEEEEGGGSGGRTGGRGGGLEDKGALLLQSLELRMGAAWCACACVCVCAYVCVRVRVCVRMCVCVWVHGYYMCVMIEGVCSDVVYACDWKVRECMGDV